LYSYWYCIYPLPQPHSHPIPSGTALAWWPSAEIRILVDFSSIAGPVQRANRRFRPVPHSLPPSPLAPVVAILAFYTNPTFCVRSQERIFVIAYLLSASLTHPAHITPIIGVITSALFQTVPALKLLVHGTRHVHPPRAVAPCIRGTLWNCL